MPVVSKVTSDRVSGHRYKLEIILVARRTRERRTRHPGALGPTPSGFLVNHSLARWDCARDLQAHRVALQFQGSSIHLKVVPVEIFQARKSRKSISRVRQGPDCRYSKTYQRSEGPSQGSLAAALFSIKAFSSLPYYQLTQQIHPRA